MERQLKFLAMIFVTGVVFASQAMALPLDLADVVGGGNGFGTGTPDTGIDPRTGSIVSGITATDNPGASNIYNSVAYSFVDGVFVPDGNVGGSSVMTQVSSTGLMAQFPNTDGNSWEQGIGYNSGSGNGNLRIDGTVTNVYSAPNSGLGFHSNKGITFDLAAIEAATGQRPARYTGWVDVRVAASSHGDIGHHVLLDGVITAKELNLRDDGSDAAFFDVAIPAGTRFLTLAGTTGPDVNYNGDAGIIGNPTLTLVPEPSTICLFGLGAVGVVLLRLRGRKS